jgi:hypothetical protein
MTHEYSAAAGLLFEARRRGQQYPKRVPVVRDRGDRHGVARATVKRTE